METSTLPIIIRETVTRTDRTRGGHELYNLTRQCQMPKEVTVPKTELAHVRFGVSQTLNLGNYESLRLEVSVEIPCHAGGEGAALDRSKEIAVQKLSQFRAEALGETA
jgi:hypothetical protein